MRDTIKAAGIQTKKETVELGLQASAKLKQQERSGLLTCSTECCFVK
ncbi:MAG: hypothetical protein ACREQZ_14470 [Woeseiaceae bacterium]